MNWLVADITYGCMSYVRNSGPRTIPPAIPVAPHKIAAIMQKKESIAISLILLNL
jgi:hypothetical protein